MKNTNYKKILCRIIIALLCMVLVAGAYRQGLISIHKGNTTPKDLPIGEQTTFPILTGTLLTSPVKSHPRIIDLIQQAKYTIDIWGYQISDTAFINVLKQKALQGVKIRIILENKTYGEISKEYRQFQKQIANTSITIQSDEHLDINFQHAKTIIIDNKTFMVSSANFTYGGFFANREHRFIASEPHHTKLLSEQFTADRTDKPGIGMTYPSSLRICPYNCRDELSRLITHAQSEIVIQAQYIEDPLFISQLVEKIASGVTIRIIVGKYHDTKLPTSIAATVRYMTKPNVHAKAILVDGSKLYLGSMNFSANAVEKNREIGIVTQDTSVIRQFLGQFDEDRHALTP